MQTFLLAFSERDFISQEILGIAEELFYFFCFHLSSFFFIFQQSFNIVFNSSEFLKKRKEPKEKKDE